jgi:hypothetical protein
MLCGSRASKLSKAGDSGQRHYGLSRSLLFDFFEKISITHWNIGIFLLMNSMRYMGCRESSLSRRQFQLLNPI